MTTPIWQPLKNTIISITKANPGVVTTELDHGYYTGLIVRFFFPANYGMSQLLGNIYTITVLSDTTFSINANTSNFDSFDASDTSQTPQVSPVGEVANTLLNAERNLLTPIGG